MNKVVLIGRLTKDPELKFTQSGKGVCNFTLAVDRPFSSASGEREADFINIVVWNKPAENCATYLSKGKKCAIEGRLQIRSYEGDDGKRRYITEVIANSVEFLTPKTDNGGNKQEKAPVQDDDFYHGPYEGLADDELPF